MTDRNKKIDEILERAVVNFAKSIPADVVKSNVEFESNAGMRPRIVRSSDGKCCPWCSSLAGEYYADEAPDDIYARHDNCICTVTYISGKGYQDAYTKKWIAQKETEARRNRIAGDRAYIETLRREREAEKAQRIAKDKKHNLLLNAEKSDIIKPTKTYTRHMSTPRIDEPYAIIDATNHYGKVTKRSFYNADGALTLEIHTTNHGNPKHHTLGANGEHVVEYHWDEDGSLRKKVERDLTAEEIKKNRGIL